MGEYNVHRVRFFDYVPSGIRTLAFNPNTERIALARMDGSVEIFNCADNFFQEKIIAGKEQVGTEALSWVGERLFSAGLNGEITEYDLTNLKSKYSIDAYGGPIWTITGNKQGTHLAVGCEDGTVKLFVVNEDKVQFERNLDRQKGRIVSLSWHPSGDKLAAGMIDTIQMFNVESGHSIHRVLVDRGVAASRGKECVVWSVLYLSDGTVFSADSAGRVQVWDDSTGTLIKSHSVATCDVLALAVSQEEDSVVAGTSEGCVVQFQSVSLIIGQEAKEWTQTRTFRNHTHDVRALAEISRAVVSGGMDTVLAVRPLLDKIEVRSSASAQRIIRFPHRRLVSCARKSGLMLFQYRGHLELWRLGESDGEGSPGSSLAIKRKPEKLLELKVKGEDHVGCSAVSPCGEWLAYSTPSTLRLYRLRCDGTDVSITKVSKLPKVLGSASQLCFSPDSSRLFSASAKASVHVVSLSQSGCKLEATLKPKSGVHQTVHALAVSEDGKWLASADSSPEVHVYNLQTRTLHCRVPAHTSAVSAMAIHPSTNHLFMTHADQQIMEFSIEQKQYSDWSRRLQRSGLHPLWLNRDTPCLSVMFPTHNPSHVILSDMYMLCVIDKNMPLPDKKAQFFNQLTLKCLPEEQRKSHSHAFKVCKSYKEILYVDLMRDQSLVVVERPLTDIIAQLPAPIKQKKFAT